MVSGSISGFGAWAAHGLVSGHQPSPATLLILIGIGLGVAAGLAQWRPSLPAAAAGALAVQGSGHLLLASSGGHHHTTADPYGGGAMLLGHVTIAAVTAIAAAGAEQALLRVVAQAVRWLLPRLPRPILIPIADTSHARTDRHGPITRASFVTAGIRGPPASLRVLPLP